MLHVHTLKVHNLGDVIFKFILNLIQNLKLTVAKACLKWKELNPSAGIKYIHVYYNTIIRSYLPSLEEDIYIKNLGKYQI